jgi:hypothetical protein
LIWLEILNKYSQLCISKSYALKKLGDLISHQTTSIFNPKHVLKQSEINHFLIDSQGNIPPALKTDCTHIIHTHSKVSAHNNWLLEAENDLTASSTEVLMSERRPVQALDET